MNLETIWLMPKVAFASIDLTSSLINSSGNGRLLLVADSEDSSANFFLVGVQKRSDDFCFNSSFVSSSNLISSNEGNFKGNTTSSSSMDKNSILNWSKRL